MCFVFFLCGFWKDLTWDSPWGFSSYLAADPAWTLRPNAKRGGFVQPPSKKCRFGPMVFAGKLRGFFHSVRFSATKSGKHPWIQQAGVEGWQDLLIASWCFFHLSGKAVGFSNRIGHDFGRSKILHVANSIKIIVSPIKTDSTISTISKFEPHFILAQLHTKKASGSSHRSQREEQRIIRMLLSLLHQRLWVKLDNKIQIRFRSTSQTFGFR